MLWTLKGQKLSSLVSVLSWWWFRWSWRRKTMWKWFLHDNNQADMRCTTSEICKRLCIHGVNWFHPTVKGWESWDCSEWKREMSVCLSLVYINTWREATKRTEPGAFQWFIGTGQEAEDTNWNTGNSTWRTEALLCYAGEGALTQAAQKLWGLLLRDLPKVPGHGCGHPALGAPAGTGGRTQRSLPASAILRFCGSASM